VRPTDCHDQQYQTDTFITRHFANANIAHVAVYSSIALLCLRYRQGMPLFTHSLGASSENIVLSIILPKQSFGYFSDADIVRLASASLMAMVTGRSRNFVIGMRRRMATRGHDAVQGHSGSSILVPIALHLTPRYCRLDANSQIFVVNRLDT